VRIVGTIFRLKKFGKDARSKKTTSDLNTFLCIC